MRIIALVTVILLLACDSGSEPQFSFNYMPAEAGEMDGIEVEPGIRQVRVQGPFEICRGSGLRARLDRSGSALTITVRADACADPLDTTLVVYQLYWFGLSSGSYTLRVDHRGDQAREDGTVTTENIVVR
jgi:hypothetical protein